MKILDATCGPKTIWYQKNHPFVTFMDIRKEKINTLQKGNNLVCKRIINIDPDVIADWSSLPFPDNHFDMVVFDPPHIIQKKKTKPSQMKLKYGYFLESEYKTILVHGVAELFRVLKPEGTFIFKWSETSKKVDEILKLFPYQPMFGTRTGQANNTHWIVFIKHNMNGRLET